MYTEGKLSLIGFDFQEQLLFVCYCVHISHGCVFHYVFSFAYVKRSKKRGLREGKIERELSSFFSTFGVHKSVVV